MKSPIRIFLRLINKFDLATSLFRSFEIFALNGILQDLQMKEPVLDLGCAEGHIAKETFSNLKIFGLDYEIKFLLEAKQSEFYNSLVNADARKMPFKDNSFGFLFSNSVLEHIERIDNVLNEAKRVLKPNGLFLFTVPNNNFSSNLFFYNLFRLLGLKELALKYSNERNRRLNHFHLYPQNTWAKIISDYGLQIVLMRNYVSGVTLSVWDLIAAIQFILRKIFVVFLKIPLVKNILFIIAYVIKILAAFILMAFFLFFKKNQSNGCATLVLVSKK